MLDSPNAISRTGLYVFKNENLEIQQCNDGFLHYTNINSVEDAIGLADPVLPWAEYTEIYKKHDLDALNGLVYSTIVPIKDYKSRSFLTLNTRYPRRNDNGNIIGIVSCAVEIINPQLNNFQYLFQESEISVHPGYYTIDYECQNLKLTQRESECLYYILRGKTTKMIGRILNISPKTVDKYISNLKALFNVNYKSELIDAALKLGYFGMLPKSLVENNFYQS